MKDDQEDEDVRRVAAESAKQALKVASKEAQDYVKWKQDYVAGLADMLGDKKHEAERIFAACALGDPEWLRRTSRELYLSPPAMNEKESPMFNVSPRSQSRRFQGSR